MKGCRLSGPSDTRQDPTSADRQTPHSYRRILPCMVVKQREELCLFLIVDAKRLQSFVRPLCQRLIHKLKFTLKKKRRVARLLQGTQPFQRSGQAPSKS